MKHTLKTLTLTIALLVGSVSVSYAEWIALGRNDAAEFYVDYERIRNIDEYVYFWSVSDLHKPNDLGVLSIKRYIQGDCKLFRYKDLTVIFHKEPMGGGKGNEYSFDENWKYPPPNSGTEGILKSVCSR